MAAVDASGRVSRGDVGGPAVDLTIVGDVPGALTRRRRRRGLHGRAAARTNLPRGRRRRARRGRDDGASTEDDLRCVGGCVHTSNCVVAANFAISAVLMMRFAELAAPFFDTAESDRVPPQRQDRRAIGNSGHDRRADGGRFVGLGPDPTEDRGLSRAPVGERGRREFGCMGSAWRQVGAPGRHLGSDRPDADHSPGQLRPLVVHAGGAPGVQAHRRPPRSHPRPRPPPRYLVSQHVRVLASAEMDSLARACGRWDRRHDCSRVLATRSARSAPITQQRGTDRVAEPVADIGSLVAQTDGYQVGEGVRFRSPRRLASTATPTRSSSSTGASTALPVTGRSRHWCSRADLPSWSTVAGSHLPLARRTTARH